MARPLQPMSMAPSITKPSGTLPHTANWMTKAHKRLVNSSGAMVEAEARRSASNTKNWDVAPATDSASSSAQSSRDGVFHTHGRMNPASTKKPRLVMSMLTLVGSESLVNRINMVEIDQSPAAQSASRTGP